MIAADKKYNGRHLAGRCQKIIASCEADQTAEVIHC